MRPEFRNLRLLQRPMCLVCQFKIKFLKKENGSNMLVLGWVFPPPIISFFFFVSFLCTLAFIILQRHLSRRAWCFSAQNIFCVIHFFAFVLWQSEHTQSMLNTCVPVQGGKGVGGFSLLFKCLPTHLFPSTNERDKTEKKHTHTHTMNFVFKPFAEMCAHERHILTMVLFYNHAPSSPNQVFSYRYVHDREIHLSIFFLTKVVCCCFFPLIKNKKKPIPQSR